MVAELSQLGFESFVEVEWGLLAYVPAWQFSEPALQDLQMRYANQCPFVYTYQHIPAQNWNEVWEADYAPIELEGICRVRSLFHLPRPDFPYEIIIQPRMAFGTGHHATTALMLTLILNHPSPFRKVLDAGCGTAVLAILAEKKGADQILALDTDEWAVENALDNLVHNQCQHIAVHQSAWPDFARANPSWANFDLIMANITKNVLLTEMPVYAAALREEGFLFLSGFYEADLAEIRQKAQDFRLEFVNYRGKEDWVAASFVKTA
ncbi:MAG: 50S ribosomal protein L11 methyltransferase [Microscillaceae bacterium]